MSGMIQVSLCLLLAMVSTTTTTSPAGPCDGDWSEFYGHCRRGHATKCLYLVCTNHGDHYAKQTDCSRDCKDAGGKVASIHSQEENNFILSLLPVHSDGEKKAWIGAGRKWGLIWSGSWYWNDGSPWGYENWSEGEPDGNYRCAAMAGYRAGTVGGWWNWHCDPPPNAEYPKDCVCKKWTNY